jgi:hypothetical protein
MHLSLTVKSLTTTDFTLEIDSSMTVAALKQRISIKTNLPTNLLRLVYCGTLLTDNLVLNVTIKESKFIHLVVSTTKLTHSNPCISNHKNTNTRLNTLPLSLPPNSQLLVIKYIATKHSGIVYSINQTNNYPDQIHHPPVVIQQNNNLNPFRNLFQDDRLPARDMLVHVPFHKIQGVWLLVKLGFLLYLFAHNGRGNIYKVN